MVKQSNPFAELLQQAATTEIGQYRPVVGYLYENGSVVKFSNDQMTWYSFDRAVSACFYFYSAAKRINGTWDATYHKRGRVKAFLMMVTDASHHPVWKQTIEIPPKPEE